MNPTEQLHYFCYEAGRLRQEPLARTGWDNSFTLNFDRTRGLSMALHQPSELAFRSLLLTPNRSPADWYPLFSNAVVGESILDRVLNSSHHGLLEGKSYRPAKRPGRRSTS